PHVPSAAATFGYAGRCGGRGGKKEGVWWAGHEPGADAPGSTMPPPRGYPRPSLIASQEEERLSCTDPGSWTGLKDFIRSLVRLFRDIPAELGRELPGRSVVSRGIGPGVPRDEPAVGHAGAGDRYVEAKDGVFAGRCRLQ